ncbi:MAG: hypothetical protein IJR71_04930 [Prevotella sp.]|nr:hypothetical protein [Prevotella sp.]
MKQQTNALTLKTITKSSVWDIQENDIFRMWEAAEKDADLKENIQRYMDILRTAFELEEIKIDKPVVIDKYEQRGFKIGSLRLDENNKQKWAVKKKPIMRVTDLTYENIRHISAAKLMEVIDRNFGGGWDSLSQSIKDIIESGFDISTTIVPKDRLHIPGGMYEKKIADGFEALEIPKGTWVEAIFAKLKPISERPHSHFGESEGNGFDENDDEEEDVHDNDSYEDDDEDDSYDDDMLTEESYRTTFETNPDDLDIESVDVSDEDY